MHVWPEITISRDSQANQEALEDCDMGGVFSEVAYRKCDHSHVHAECAGREPRKTQVYTKWIAKIIMRGINDHVNSNIPCVNVKVMKRWKAVILDDEMKRTMSRDSENARSHPSR